VPLFKKQLRRRQRPIPFRHIGRAALVDNNMKLLTNDLSGGKFELYDLERDPAETNDLAGQRAEIFQRMRKQLIDWSASVDASFDGEDYPEGKVDPSEPEPRFWTDVKAYKPYFDEWRTRWEYRSRLSKQKK
jgi:hypothetical protein